MATVAVVKAIVTADVSQLKKEMTKAQRAMDNAGKNMSKVGKSMTMKVTMPLVGMGVAAAKMASDFEFSMTQIETLVGRSTAEVETLKGAVLGLSGQTGRAPKELADAMFFITSAGLDASSATAALEASAKAAAVGLGDTVVVADAVTNAMNGYGMSADGAAFATDVLAKTVEQGKASAADLAPQFGRLIPMAAELGISFDQVGGGLAFLTRASGDAAMSATQLGGVMKSILKPSQQAKTVMEEIGIDLGTLREAASEDLLGALQGLRTSLEANGKEMGDVFEDIRGLNGALQLTGVATGAAREVFDELANSSGKLDEAFRGVQKTAQFKLSQAMAGMKAGMIELGGAILPVVVPMIQQLANVIKVIADAFASLPGPVQKIIVVLGILVAATGPVLMMIGSINAGLVSLGVTAGITTASMAAILAPLLAIIAVGAAVFAVWKMFSNRAKEAQERTDTLRDSFVALDDRTGTLKSELEGLRGELDALNEATAEAALETTEFSDQAVLLGELIERDVRKPFQDYFKDLEHHNDLIRDPIRNNSYQDLADGLRGWTGMLDSNIALLEQHSATLGADSDKIIESVRNGDLQIATLQNMLYALDETADAHDDLAKENTKLAKAWLEDTDNVVAYVQALDGLVDANGESYLAQIEAMEAAEDWTGAAAMAIDATRIATEAAREAAAAEVARTAAMDAGANSLMTAAARHGELTTRTWDDVLAARALNDSRLAAKRSADMMAESTADSAQALLDEAAAARDAARAIEARANARRDAHTILREEAQERRRINAEAERLAEIIRNTADVTALRLHPAFVDASDEVLEIALGLLDADRNLSSLQREALGLVPPLEEAKTAIELAEEALQDEKDAQQELIRLAEDGLKVAENKLATLEAEADLARQLVQDFKDQVDAERQGFEALKSAYYAEQALADATADREAILREIEAVNRLEGEAIAEATDRLREQEQVVKDIQAQVEDLVDKEKELGAVVTALTAEREAANNAEGRFQKDLVRAALRAANAEYEAKRNVASINRDITDLEAQRLDLTAEQSRHQRDLTHELNAQRLAYHDIVAQVAELEGRQQEVSAGAQEAQKNLIAGLKVEQSEITAVEQQLIDLYGGIISEADAAQADISASQAKNLLRLQEELFETEAATAAGEAGMFDLLIAQQRLSEGIADAVRPIDGLREAEERLIEMEADAERVALQLAVARDRETIALQAKTAATDIDGQMTTAITAIDLLQTEQQHKLTMATDAQTLATEVATAAKESEGLVTEELTRIDNELTEATAAQTAANDDLTAANAALAIAEAEVIVMGEMGAIQLEELERLSQALTDANWDLVAAEYADKDAKIAVAEAGDNTSDAIARMSAKSSELTLWMGAMTTQARNAYPQFDTMRATLLELEPQIASAKGEIEQMTAAISRLIAQMERLNRTKIDQTTGARIPPTGPGTDWRQDDPGVWGSQGPPPDTQLAKLKAGIEAQSGHAKYAERVAAAATLSESEATTLNRFLDSLPSAQAGGAVVKGGLVNVHAGEQIVPAGGGITVVVNVEGSVSSERDLVESIRKGLLQAQKSGRSVVLN